MNSTTGTLPGRSFLEFYLFIMDLWQKNVDLNLKNVKCDCTFESRRYLARYQNPLTTHSHPKQTDIYYIKIKIKLKHELHLPTPCRLHGRLV